MVVDKGQGTCLVEKVGFQRMGSTRAQVVASVAEVILYLHFYNQSPEASPRP